MVLRDDLRQFTIYDPEVVTAVSESIIAASLVMFGAWLQKVATRAPMRGQRGELEVDRVI